MYVASRNKENQSEFFCIFDWGRHPVLGIAFQYRIKRRSKILEAEEQLIKNPLDFHQWSILQHFRS